jgi:hypothetical protein
MIKIRPKEDRSKWFMPVICIFIVYIICLGFITGEMQWYLTAIVIEGIIIAITLITIKKYDKKEVKE